MPKIERSSLLTLEAYARQRAEIRSTVIAHKRGRTVHIGPNVTLIFEDEMTIRYQIQEMLRVERIFEEGGIQEELQAYNPLVPDGRNFKATMMLEFPEPEERKKRLRELIGIEAKTWLAVVGGRPVWAIADEDLSRDNGEKTSSVHFLRFELDEDTACFISAGKSLCVGIDHPNYRETVKLSPAISALLAKDIC